MVNVVYHTRNHDLQAVPSVMSRQECAEKEVERDGVGLGVSGEEEEEETGYLSEASAPSEFDISSSEVDQLLVTQGKVST